MSHHKTQCPWCGQSKHKVVDGARCIICDNIVELKDKCRHREDGQVKCTTCDGERTFDDSEKNRMGFEDFEGRKD